MRLYFFCVSACDSAAAFTQLNQFLASRRVMRGGSYFNKARNLRSAMRNHNAPDNRNDNTGLRLATALWAAGSIKQRYFPHTFSVQNQGLRYASPPFANRLSRGRLS